MEVARLGASSQTKRVAKEALPELSQKVQADVDHAHDECPHNQNLAPAQVFHRPSDRSIAAWGTPVNVTKRSSEREHVNGK